MRRQTQSGSVSKNNHLLALGDFQTNLKTAMRLSSYQISFAHQM